MRAGPQWTSLRFPSATGMAISPPFWKIIFEMVSGKPVLQLAEADCWQTLSLEDS